MTREPGPGPAPDSSASDSSAPDRDTELGDAVLHRIRGHHVFEACVEQLATSIRLGAYPLGSFLPAERELAERMEVSRATLREAVAALRSAGMVRTTRGRGGGTVVSYRPEDPRSGASHALLHRRGELLDMLVFRRVVEPGACHLAASRALDDGQVHLLEVSLKEVEQASGTAAHRQADSRLHLAIATATASSMMVQAVTTAQAALHDMLTAIPVLDVNIEHSNVQHKAIVGAILASEATKARRAMENHCDDTAALLRGLLG